MRSRNYQAIKWNALIAIKSSCMPKAGSRNIVRGQHPIVPHAAGWKAVKVDGRMAGRNEDIEHMSSESDFSEEREHGIDTSPFAAMQDNQGPDFGTIVNPWPLWNSSPHLSTLGNNLSSLSPSSFSSNEDEDGDLKEHLGGPYFQYHHPDSHHDRPSIIPFASEVPTLPPYHPFKSEIDYEMAAHAFFQGMTQSDTTAFFRNLKKRRLPEFSLDSFKDMRETLRRDKRSVTAGFQHHIVSAELESKTIKHHVYIRDPIEIMKEVIHDDTVRESMQFYPVKKFKQTEDVPCRNVRTYDELWTTRRCWRYQDSLPNPNGCIGAIIFYTDGTSAVKFGQKTVHPMYMWLANVPLRERSSDSKGGCQLIGFQPEIVGTDKQKKDKKFRLYKRSVYHKVIGIVLKGIHRYEHVGFKVQVGHSFNKLIFPRIFMLQADMAELYTLLLLLGIGSEFRCPICLAPKGELHNLSRQFFKRSQKQVRRDLFRYEETQAESGTVAAAKELTSRSSLRPEKSAFSRLECTDIYNCIAADPLHVFGVLPQSLIVGMIGILPAELEQEAVPALRDLVAFEVIVKMHVQDEDRILVLRQEKLVAVERALKTLSEHFGMSTTFPKGHLPPHFVDLIAEGGTLDHQTTAHGERSHRPLKEHIIARVLHSNIAGRRSYQ
ncbi:hypothetical protein BT69DRAFT_1345667 [Atractiella rhizophila]|nr:hypothetical protein BT69DRAFT_1345667 [Atractiella rhizophila]